jgi:uncharacterized protein (DUF2062 family)
MPAFPFYRFRLARRRGPRPGWREALRVGLTQGLAPHEVALALAAGTVCAFFPVLGAATPLCVLAALALRLNQPLVQAINGLSFPAYPVMAVVFVHCGERLAGAPPRGLDLAAMSRLVRSDPAAFLQRFGQTLGHAVLGWAALSAVAAPLIYALARALLRLSERRPRPLPARA